MNDLVFLTKSDAVMLSLGVKNVLPLDKHHLPSNKRCYYFVTDGGYDENTPLEWLQEEYNNRQYGNLDDFDDRPTDALWGFFDVVTPVSDYMNVWAAGLHGSGYLVENVHVFDEPLHGDVTDLRFAKNLDERPSHVCKPHFPYMRYRENELVVPLNDENYNIACVGGMMALDVTGIIAAVVNTNMDVIDVITVVNGIRSKSFCFQAEVIRDDDDIPDPPVYPSALSPSGKAIREQLVLSFAFPSLV